MLPRLLQQQQKSRSLQQWRLLLLLLPTVFQGMSLCMCALLPPPLLLS
jgi:hypothetical protein